MATYKIKFTNTFTLDTNTKFDINHSSRFRYCKPLELPLQIGKEGKYVKFVAFTHNDAAL